MQNNQQEYYFRYGNNQSNTYSNNQQQRFNNINNKTNQTRNDYYNQPYLQNNGYYPQQYNYENRSTGFMNEINDKGQVPYQPISCCGSKGHNVNNQQSQLYPYERNNQLNSYNHNDTNNYFPSSFATNRGMNMPSNAVYNTSQNQFPQQIKTFNGSNNLPSNFFDDHQRKYC